jgi:hypothetical protein
VEPLGRNGKKQKGSKINAITVRIDRLLTEEDLVILRISGRTAGQDVNMLRTLLEQEESAVGIDLKDVLLADREAEQLPGSL